MLAYLVKQPRRDRRSSQTLLKQDETNTKIQMDRCIASSGRNELRLECLHAGSSVQSGLRGQSK